ncbi:hypothetical protein HTZ77_33850 [Nonomuraea sp. SMC257]|uniref:Uncharacterized protein n=1 Tax=Nonomuraea montanisoli TaxID=2741721 RepID=A0A7Y6IDN3_9ACTN|nr:hypothetical protein [Nonomuraea montanisoli]NUW36357.1 hypothetical protein [Nonomuraea montanisoli]
MEDRLMAGRGPLCLLAGAPGAGKTYLLPYLLGGAGGLVVMDMDEILEEGALLGVPVAEPGAAPVWPAYDRLWGRIVAMVRRVGHPVLLLCPVPDAEELEPGGRWDGPLRWALLDCPDDVRRRRLEARGCPKEEIEDAMADARQGRALIPTAFASGGSYDGGADGDPAVLAARVLAWARGDGA